MFCVWVSVSGPQSVAVPHKDATLGPALWVSTVPVHVCESWRNEGTREARTSEAGEVPVWHVRQGLLDSVELLRPPLHAHRHQAKCVRVVQETLHVQTQSERAHGTSASN